MPVSLLTCVTNGGGMGPGHSCIDVNGTVYTFQDIDWGGNASGWLQFSLKKYLARNVHRPVIVQKMNSVVSDGKVLKYILGSITNDDDYLGSGVCSSQAANAIESGYHGSFNTWGVDTPYDIYKLAKKKRMVASEAMHWPGEKDCNFFVKNSIKATLMYMGAGKHV
ncbi:hypothetical protein ACQ5SO_12955 [Rhodovulum sp. DZ06]|uniref:hypothetical protein n=1 Tax=Rhodovulum sp. DZ06 TaxID=3425126 RepID=UPI003D33187C